MRTHEEISADARLLYAFLSDCPAAPARADLILAAGSHDVRVAEHASALYHAHLAPLVVCSGGFGKMTEELFREPEGVVFARRCVELGVPEDRIIVEPQATNTGENFTRSRALLSSLQISAKTGVVVCKPYMAKRAWATGTKQWPEITWHVSTPALTFEQYLAIDVPAAREISLMVGDLQRLRLYAEKGYQAPVPVPDPMWAVYARLVSDGFDEFVI